ncbi:MAG TPA: disulfide bond formation protein B [Caulobacteraceae bacterium]|jgi:disulfide bond formation protein DsbB|nr:disulfide bond formation protein B [Caulobacteraceae bacterium]
MNGLRFVIRWWVAFAFLASVAALATAHAFESFGGLAPCHLCLKQRDIYWFAIAISLPATVWALFFRSRGTPKLAALLLFGVFVAGTVIATFHAGVEMKWWKGPSTCTGSPGGGFDMAVMKAMLAGKHVATPMCDVIAWKMGGLTMAGYNAIASAILAGISLVASIRRKGDAPRAD